jgi:alpha-ribazole phosphatase
MRDVTTRFWWIRHAPVAHGGRIYGQADLSCDCSKTVLFAGLAAQLPQDAVWVASNLRRTHETAAALVRAGLPGPAAIPGPEITTLPDLAEQHFGEWQNLTYDELSRSRNGAFHRFWHAPAHEAPPAGESFAAVIERVSRAIRHLVELHAGRDVIAVAHGGTIRAALAVALGLDPEAALAFTIENCSLTRIDHMDGPGMGHGWRVVTVNRL